MSDRVDELFRRFLAGMRGRECPPMRAPLQLVTATNVAQFSQAPKRRGRPRKVPSGGNIVSIAEVRKSRAKREPAAATMSVADEIMGHFLRRLDERRAPRPLPPAPDDPVLRRRVNARAAARTLKDVQEHERCGGGTFNASRYDEHWAAVWIELGYAPPSRPHTTVPDGDGAA